MEISLRAIPKWEESTGECKPCSVCEDVVYGKGFQLVVRFPEVNGSTHTAEVKDCFLCESCYGVIKEQK